MPVYDQLRSKKTSEEIVSSVGERNLGAIIPSMGNARAEMAGELACGGPNRDKRLERPKAKQEQAMKLNSTQVKQTLSQFEAEVLPDNHPAVPQLHSIFGDHTFFLDDSGLNVLEPAETPELQVHAGEVVSLASWSDATLTSLRPHEPEPTGVVILLEPRH